MHSLLMFIFFILGRRFMFGRHGALALSDVFVMICGTVRASLLVKPYLVIARETGEVIMPD